MQIYVPVELLRQLQGGLSQAREAGAAALLDVEQLRQLLLLLASCVGQGLEVRLDEGDKVSTCTHAYTVRATRCALSSGTRQSAGSSGGQVQLQQVQ